MAMVDKINYNWVYVSNIVLQGYVLGLLLFFNKLIIFQFESTSE